MSSGGKLNSIHALRGLASFWVCWFHLTRGGEAFPTWGPLRASGSNGWLGVEMFFVISGFIIPYVLHKSRYTLGDFKNFALKRLVRLEPPYLVSIGLILLLNYASTLSSLYKGPPFGVNVPQLLLHLGYLIPFSRYIWINDAFWTLAIEFQYYLLLGLLFPFLMKNRAMGILLTVLLMIAACAIGTYKVVIRWFFLFFMGFLTFRRYAGLDRWPLSLLLLAVGFIGCCYTVGTSAAIAGIFAVWFILFFKYHNFAFEFLGNVSYSLYLIHIPTGGRVINLGSRFAVSELSQVAVVFLALGVSLTCAWLLYRFVEKPAQEWAASIRYR